MNTHTTEDRVARLSESWAVLGISARTGHYWVKNRILPQPMALGPKARGYRVSTLMAFLESREAAAS